MHGKRTICGLGFRLMAALCAGGCGQPPSAAPADAPPVPAEREKVAVSGPAALEEVRRFVELGPREAGTPGAERAANYLLIRLREIGVEAEIQEFRDASPRGKTTFRNVLGRIPGKSGQIILFGSHYDTKGGIEHFPGANDSGSSTGLLLELAKGFLAAAPHKMEIRFAFFDGEECQVHYGPADGFHGSRHLAGTMAADGRLTDIAAMILLDMVGDRNLTVTIPRNSTPWLAALAFETARAEGVRAYFQLFPGNIGDDHVAFYERGVPAINLIDFHFGSAPGRNDYWHTAEDTLDKVSAESLEIVGRVAARMAEAVAGRAPPGK
ncbi:MAG: M28 family peptidase [Kiritimatiellae bacterium]|nr:M28 family peptidase [Kiritimatiellia bacterium]HPC20296.1 M28 family peptidase [Kiritimatiellia bacterium]HQN81082.1 M28 family peptidase [Kiritimatiellia bacterium]HQQ59931.1 M28 family peptidase [Kiritimatiellia bacterium]